jgi:hypothetical protein
VRAHAILVPRARIAFSTVSPSRFAASLGEAPRDGRFAIDFFPPQANGVQAHCRDTAWAATSRRRPMSRPPEAEGKESQQPASRCCILQKICASGPEAAPRCAKFRRPPLLCRVLDMSARILIKFRFGPEPSATLGYVFSAKSQGTDESNRFHSRGNRLAGRCAGQAFFGADPGVLTSEPFDKG